MAMNLRWTIFAVLGFVHAVLVTTPTFSSPLTAFTVYAPLAGLNMIGLPVFRPGESFGWSEPSTLGWIGVTLIWAVIWLVVATLLTKLVRKRET